MTPLHMIDDTWSQAHALMMVDLNGDGRPDFITGKRYMAHNGSDPGEREPLGIYWYEYGPTKDGRDRSVHRALRRDADLRDDGARPSGRCGRASVLTRRSRCSVSRIYPARCMLMKPCGYQDAALDQHVERN